MGLFSRCQQAFPWPVDGNRVALQVHTGILGLVWALCGHDGGAAGQRNIMPGK